MKEGEREREREFDRERNVHKQTLLEILCCDGI